MSIQNQPDLHELRLRQVDGELAKWRIATLPSPPPAGWIQTIRASLGMTATALAKRLGMTGAGLRGIEASEADERITLATLRLSSQGTRGWSGSSLPEAGRAG